MQAMLVRNPPQQIAKLYLKMLWWGIHPNNRSVEVWVWKSEISSWSLTYPNVNRRLFHTVVCLSAHVFMAQPQSWSSLFFSLIISGHTAAPVY